jgi:hypothetical protein
MPRFIYHSTGVILIVLLFSCSNYGQTIQNILNQVNTDSITYFVKELSGNVPTIIGGAPYTIASRNKNQPGNDKAMQYIQEKLQSYGLQTTIQTFSTTGKNVYAVQPGLVYPNRKYIICAHFDDMPSGTLAPGADDNASGTAAVLEAARIFSDYQFQYTIIYALWDEEEQGLIGSAYYANQAFAQGDSIMGVINLDMIAWDSNNNNVANIHTRNVGTSLTLYNKMVEMNTTYNVGLTLVVMNPGSTYSDHASFWNRNYGAILLIEDDNDFNAYYHTTSDLFFYYNVPYFVKSAKLSYATLASFAVDVVPVELHSFTSEIAGNSLMLKWVTATETNNSGFEVQKSYDQKTWTTMEFIEGAGTTTAVNSYSYTERITSAGICYYRLKQIDYNGVAEIHGPIEVDLSQNMKYVLGQNYPNPFNPSTTLSYSLPQSGFVKLSVYNQIGEEVAQLVNENKEAGNYEVTFDASGLTSGVYFYKLSSGTFNDIKKMILVK